ncbi:Hypothetical_protein [Hexamita inflata]|uniref:Hypothetical_protein n=1 Tax=Hexamita inflata TaxID=28002 RepID=A0AA86PET4_9EUKA|nr:Hypothetical protein HINF_LOCUS25605 [Hexamita inflata]CAI9937965.1 Hypothetical protein HINF_LOCUS25610 [Hexamita inflata]CAI9945151.1 Hypothetical protein HINF_LOCUS32796 [Hexamita inflata]
MDQKRNSSRHGTASEKNNKYISLPRDFIETFESKTQALARHQQVGILMSNYRQTDYVFRKKTRKAQDQPTELNIQEIDQTEEFSSIPVNETTNSNAGTQNTSVKPKNHLRSPRIQITPRRTKELSIFKNKLL